MMNFEIPTMLTFCNWDHEMVDQDRLQEMTNTFVKVSEIAEDNDQK
jgi:hypothetical protein